MLHVTIIAALSKAGETYFHRDIKALLHAELAPYKVWLGWKVMMLSASRRQSTRRTAQESYKSH